MKSKRLPPFAKDPPRVTNLLLWNLREKLWTQIYSQGPHSERIEGIPRRITSGDPASDSTTRD